MVHLKNGSEAQSLQSRVSEQKTPSQDLSEPFPVGRFQLNKLCLHSCGDFGAALLSLSAKCSAVTYIGRWVHGEQAGHSASLQCAGVPEEKQDSSTLFAFYHWGSAPHWATLACCPLRSFQALHLGWKKPENRQVVPRQGR